MKSDKVISTIITICFLVPFALPLLIMIIIAIVNAGISANDYARITDVDYTAIVVDEPESEGKVVVTERLTFDIHAASKGNLFWELWRDLPEDYVDGVKVHYKVNSVKQIMDDGTEIIYEESPKLYWDDYDYVSTNPTYGPGKWYHSEGPYDEDAAMYECVFFYVDGLYREEVVFEIEYEMYNAALRYNDCSDLYLALYSEETINYLESFKAQILFPNKDMPSQGNYNVYTYGTNANSFPVEESATKNPGYYTFSFELDEDDLKFKSYNEYIEFDLVSYGEDKHIFTEYAPSNYYSYDDVLGEILAEQHEYATTPAKFLTAKIVVLALAIGGSVCILIYVLRTDARMRLKHIFYNSSMDIDYFRDIPSDLDPNFAASLIHCKHKPPKDDSGVYSAILLSLARKEYIELSECGETVLITITKPPTPVVPVTPIVNTVFGSPSMGTATMDPINWNSDWDDSSLNLDNTDVALENTGMTTETVSVEIPVTETTTVETPTMDTLVSEPEIPEKEYEPLTLCEEYYFNLLVRHANGSSIFMEHFQKRVSSDYENTDAFARNMENSIVNIGVKDGYFQKADYTQPQKEIRSKASTFTVIGILVVIFANLISNSTRMDLAFGAYFIFGITCIVGAFFLKKKASKYVLLTQYGEDEYAKWRGLYNFLNSDTLISERTYVELPMWEKYLVYATAFGLSEKVIKAIGIRCPEASESTILNNNYCRSGRFHRTGRSFRSAVRSGSSTARSGGSGGFGYGGGGRGGGGGGGGH